VVDPAIAALSDQLKLATQELAKIARASREAAAALKAPGEEAERTGEKLGEASRSASVFSEKIGEGIRRGTGFEEATKRGGRAVNTLATALANLTENALTNATERMGEFVRQLPEGAAAGERHEEVLNRLGSAYADVQRATAGAVSAEQAFAVQQRAAQSGLQLTARELSAVTQRAREYARATGSELGQALDQLTDQLVDPGEELRKFGVFLRSGMDAGDALRETLRQLTEQAERTTASEATLAERMEQLSRAQDEARNSASLLIARKLELGEFFSSLTSWIQDTTRATSGWQRVTEALVGTLREAVGLQSQAPGDGTTQSASGAFTAEAGGIAQELRRSGVNLGGFQFGEFAVRATPAQREAALRALREARIATGPGEGTDASEGAADLDAATTRLISTLRRLENEAFVAAEERSVNASLEQVRAQADRDAELARRNRASASASSARGSASTRPPKKTIEQLMERAIAGEGTLARQLGLDGRPELLDENAGAGRGTPSVAAQMPSAEDSTRAALESMGRGVRGREGGERVAALRQQSEALRAMLENNRLAIDSARELGQGEARINDLYAARAELLTANSENMRMLNEATGETSNGLTEFGDAMKAHLEQVTEAFGEGIAAALEGTKSFAQSMEEMLRSQLRSLVKEAVVHGLKHTALGIGKLASQDYPGAALEFATVAAWTAVGVAAGAGLSAMGPPPGAQGAAPKPASASSDRAARADSGAPGGGGPLNLTINVSGAAFTDAGVQRAVSESIREAAANGYLTPAHLGGLRG
jgi:hypothetical protein